MSCCEYRWYDGYNTTAGLRNFKVEWALSDGTAAGWFLFSSRWSTQEYYAGLAIGAGGGVPPEHSREWPFESQIAQRLRQITGKCADDVPYTWSVVAVTPAVLTPVGGT